MSEDKNDNTDNQEVKPSDKPMSDLINDASTRTTTKTESDLSKNKRLERERTYSDD
jgi:hypothetical protein